MLRFRLQREWPLNYGYERNNQISRIGRLGVRKSKERGTVAVVAWRCVTEESSNPRLYERASPKDLAGIPFDIRTRLS